MSEDDEIDYSLKPMERFEQYIKTDKQSKLVHCAECVIDCVSEVDSIEKITNVLIPGVESLLTSDDDDVSDSMLMMLPDFVDEVFKTQPNNAEKILIDNLLPIVHEVAKYDTDQFAESYAAICLKLPHAYFAEKEALFLKELSKDEETYIRMNIANVILYLVEQIDPSIWYSTLCDIITLFTSDSNDEIRMKIPPLIALYTKELKTPKEKALLSGKFTLFVRDPCPDVRKSAAESLVTICTALDHSSRIITVIPAARLLLSDQSEETRDCMRKNLGPLVSSLGPLADRSLVSQYCTSLVSCSTDLNISFASAYSFPAVVTAIGANRFNELRSAFESVSASREYRIRRTLSFGLIEIATFLEKEELIDAAFNFLRDIPSVSIGVISNLDKLLELLPDRKGEFLWCLQEPYRYPDWRLRLKVSEQCRNCVSKFFKREDLLPIAQQLCVDKVWAVRKDAALTCANLMIKKDMKFIEKLAKSKGYQEREMAALIIQLIEHKWTSEFVKVLEILAKDPVANVRIMAAKTTKIINQKVLISISLMRLIKKFKSDKDADVVLSIESEE